MFSGGCLIKISPELVPQPLISSSKLFSILWPERAFKNMNLTILISHENPSTAPHNSLNKQLSTLYAVSKTHKSVPLGS